MARENCSINIFANTRGRCDLLQSVGQGLEAGEVPDQLEHPHDPHHPHQADHLPSLPYYLHNKVMDNLDIKVHKLIDPPSCLQAPRVSLLERPVIWP